MKTNKDNARLAADRRYEVKRSLMQRLPGGYLTQKESDLLNEMASIHGNKKNAIFKGLALLKKQSEDNSE